MLRAALIGFPSTGKTTLFHLMTATRETTRVHGRADAAVGISRVPDGRLDRLTAMFNPRKRVPAMGRITTRPSSTCTMGSGDDPTNVASGWRTTYM